MKCKVIQEQLLNYIDRKLSIEASKKITSHLLNCEICEKTYRRYQKTHESGCCWRNQINIKFISLLANGFEANGSLVYLLLIILICG
ncbi:zf-HC2 domain-containing protein [Candidatus Poribacteria bacterium]|nr:zf-HC2 domain-containing protein [Candidatus Poribacteria bacterium]